MSPTGKIWFHKVNGIKPRGIELEVKINGELVYRPVVQTNACSDVPTHYRLAGSKLVDDKKCYQIRYGNHVEEAIDILSRKVKDKFTPKGLAGILSMIGFGRPEIEIGIRKYHK